MNYQKNVFDINKLISTYVKPAVGCTEPAAIALSASTAFSCASGKIASFITQEVINKDKTTFSDYTVDDISSIELTLDTNVLKNALYVSIPGTNHNHGVDLAVILGILANPDSELSIFESIKQDPEEVLKTIEEKKLKEKVKIHQKESNGIYIETLIKFKDQTISQAIIRGSHANIVSVRRNNVDLIEEKTFVTSEDMNLTELKELTIDDMLLEIDNNLSSDSKNRLWDGILMNMKVAKTGLTKVYGDGIGYAHNKMAVLEGGVIGKIIANVAAATDVRMAGTNIPVMSNVGSGNQGLIISVSLCILAEYMLKKPLKEFSEGDKELLIKTYSLATVITAYATSYTGMLSNLCGCLNKAGVGATAGMAYYLYHFESPEDRMGLSLAEVILNAMKNMIASACGILCDGAKGSCSNKSKSAGFNAYTSACEALSGYVGTGGIPGYENTEIKTIMKNFVETYIEKFGQPTDLHIVNYLLSSNC